MARVTVEGCLERISNRFALTVLAARRARALAEGRGTPLVECENREAVTALREVEDGLVRFREDVNEAIAEFIEDQRRQLRSTQAEHTFLEAASFVVPGDDDDGEAYDDLEDEVHELGEEPPTRRRADSDDDSDEETDNEDGLEVTSEDLDADADLDAIDDDAEPDVAEDDEVATDDEGP